MKRTIGSYVENGYVVTVCKPQRVVHSKMHINGGVCRHPLPLERKRESNWIPESGTTHILRKGK